MNVMGTYVKYAITIVLQYFLVCWRQTLNVDILNFILWSSIRQIGSSYTLNF